MAVPDLLAQFLKGARSNIERAHNFDVTAAARRAEVMLRDAQGYTEATAAITAAFEDAIGRLADFHEEVVDQNTLVPRGTRAIENARGIAVIAIERLEDALMDARPSDAARAVGLDWF